MPSLTSSPSPRSDSSLNLQREAGLLPVVLSLRVPSNVRVAHGLELAGGELGVSAGGVRAVGDDRRILVRQKRSRLLGDDLEMDVDGAGQVSLLEVLVAQGLDDGDLVRVEARASSARSIVSVMSLLI